jgi:hypothetical protein
VTFAEDGSASFNTRISSPPVVLPVHLFSQTIFRRYVMPVQWTKDVDAAFAAAKEANKRVLLDFSAAPS